MSARAGAPPSRHQVLLLAGLGAVLVTLILFQVVLPMMSGGDAAPAASGGVAPATAPAGAAGRGAAAKPSAAGAVEELQLAKLEQAWPEPVGSRRNPFSMAPDPPPVAAPATTKPAAPVETQPTGPPPPPPVPPITLKFIGVISGPDDRGKIAALSDGKFVYRGREGQIVEGRYRIVRIGEESIQIEYANGTGRQTIRLTGK